MDDNIEIATLQVADDLLQELSHRNLPREGHEFIKSYGMQLLYERLKRSGRLEEYIRRLNSFKLQRRNEIRNRMERYDGSRREGQEFPFGERSARATVQAFQCLQYSLRRN